MNKRDQYADKRNRRRRQIAVVKSPSLAGMIEVKIKIEGMSQFSIFANTIEEGEEKKNRVIERYTNKTRNMKGTLAT